MVDYNLNKNTYYTYAFYDGNTNESSNIMTNTNAIVYTILQTGNYYVSLLTATSITSTSTNLSFTLDTLDSSQNGIFELYRFDGSSAPTTLDNTGTHLTTISIGYGNITTNNTYTETSLNPNVTYTYAFYDGTIIDKSKIMLNNQNDLIPTSLTIETFYAIINSISGSNVTFDSAEIDYEIQNILINDVDVYLYRFDGIITPPVLLDTVNGTIITNIAVESGSPITGNYVDSGLTANTAYTYAFYNGNINNTSELLTNNNLEFMFANVITDVITNNISNNTATISK